MGEEAEEPRQPKTHEVELKATVGTRATVEAEVQRGVNADRLAVLAILLGIGTTVAFGVHGVSWLCRVGLGLGTFILAATLLNVLLRFDQTTDVTMRFARWVLGGRG